MMRVEMSRRSATDQRYSDGGVLRMVGEVRRGIDRLRLGVSGWEVDRARRGRVEHLPFAVGAVQQWVVADVLGERRDGGDVAVVRVVVVQCRLHVGGAATLHQVLGGTDDRIAWDLRIASAARGPRRWQ